LSTEVMDHAQFYSELQDEKQTLWTYFAALPGVLRVDSCRRTQDLGKWNISTNKANYPAVTKWFDEKLQPIFESIPSSVREPSSFADFPNPRRLSRSTQQNYTQPSPDSKSAYRQVLASRVGSPPAAATVQRSAWRPFQPVIDVSYAFNECDFPPMRKETTSDTKSTASMSHFSSASEQAIKDAISAETDKIRIESRKRESDIDTRIQNIESSLQTLATSLVSQIYAMLSGPDSPFVTVSLLDEKLDRLSIHIEKLCQASNSPPRDTGNRNRKQARLSGPDQPDPSDQSTMAIDAESPDSPHE